MLFSSKLWFNLFDSLVNICMTKGAWPKKGSAGDTRIHTSTLNQTDNLMILWIFFYIKLFQIDSLSAIKGFYIIIAIKKGIVLNVVLLTEVNKMAWIIRWAVGSKNTMALLLQRLEELVMQCLASNQTTLSHSSHPFSVGSLHLLHDEYFVF